MLVENNDFLIIHLSYKPPPPCVFLDLPKNVRNYFLLTFLLVIKLLLD